MKGVRISWKKAYGTNGQVEFVVSASAFIIKRWRRVVIGVGFLKALKVVGTIRTRFEYNENFKFYFPASLSSDTPHHI